MISFILLNFAFLVVIYSIYNFMFSRPKNFPPGPPRIPFFGGYFFMLVLNRQHLQKAAIKLCEYYKSNIIGLHLGSMPLVILNDNDKVRKALNMRELVGRPDGLMVRMRDPKMNLTGVFFTEGELWTEQRRFALRYLRENGFGRRCDTLESEIQSELVQFIDLLKNGPKYEHEKKWIKDGQILLPLGFGPTFANCFFKVLFNERCTREQSADLYEAIEMTFQFQRKTDEYGKLYSVIPAVAKLFPMKSDYATGRWASMRLFEIFRKIIDEQINTFDEDHDRHFVDMYVRKMREADAAGDDTSTFSYDQLVMTCIDFSFPTFASLPTTVAFLIQQICIEPEVQLKIQIEIDHVVGEGRMPTLDDRINMPYTEAALREIMRFETLAPSGLPHKALVHTKFMGYDIPKGTMIIAALGAANHDNSVWDAPHEFKPERFLDSDGKLSLKNDQSLPFGTGKRSCAGETFARNMLFLFTAAFFQAFSVQRPPGQKIHKFEDNATGMIRTTPDHWVQLHAR